MGVTAENLAVKYSLTREECDEFALRSHRLASEAWDSGYFDEQVVPIEAPAGKGKTVLISRDETVRPETTTEALADQNLHLRKTE